MHAHTHAHTHARTHAHTHTHTHTHTRTHTKYRLPSVLRARALLLWQRLLARLEVGDSSEHMATVLLAPAVCLAMKITQQDAAVVAKRGGGIIAIRARQHCRILAHELGFHHGHQRIIDLQICRRGGTSLPACWARKSTICTSCLPAPAYQTLPTERVEARQNTRRARFCCLVCFAAEHAADGVHACIVALHRCGSTHRRHHNRRFVCVFFIFSAQIWFVVQKNMELPLAFHMQSNFGNFNSRY